MASSSSGVAGRRSLHCVHTRRTRRWASTSSRESEKLNGASPISSNRVMLSAAELVCRVASTRWPVNEASMARLAVSASRISPIMMTSGSARRKVRIAAAKDQPMRALTCTWHRPGWVISMGSSAVQILVPPG